MIRTRFPHGLLAAAFLLLAGCAGARFAGELPNARIAPDIEGRDLDGEAFKLSDYRGKVVVLDFWGHW